MNNNFLSAVANFVKLAIDSTEDLQDQVLAHKKAAAIEHLNEEKYRIELHKAADSLYDSDFLTDEQEKRKFLRKAAEDKVYVVRTLQKVCEAADVAQIGKPARVAARPKQAEYDPVMAAAFGYDSNRGIMDE
jgi:hypothetical protein